MRLWAVCSFPVVKLAVPNNTNISSSIAMVITGGEKKSGLFCLFTENVGAFLLSFPHWEVKSFAGQGI